MKSLKIYISIIVSLISICALVSFCSFDQPEKKNEPRIYIPQSTIDLGTFRGNVGIERVQCRILNTGRAPLELRSIEGRCPCLELSLTRDLLLPGEEAILEATVSPASTPGDWKETIIVRSNDPSNPEVSIIIKSYTELPFTIIPNRVYINNLRPNSTQNSSFEVLASTNTSSGQLVDVSVGSEHITIHTIKETPSFGSSRKKQWKIDLTVSSRGISSWEDIISISTSDLNQPELQIPILVNEIPLFNIEPRTVLLQRSNQRDSNKAKVTITSTVPTHSLEVSEIRKPNWLEVYEVNHTTDGNCIQLHIAPATSLDPQKSLLKANITVTFEDIDDFVSIPVLLFQSVELNELDESEPALGESFGERS